MGTMRQLEPKQRTLALNLLLGHLVATYFQTVAFLLWLIWGLVAMADGNILEIELTNGGHTLPAYDLFWTAVWVPLVAAVFHGVQFRSISTMLTSKSQNLARARPYVFGKGWGAFPNALGSVLCLSVRTRKMLAYSTIVRGVNFIRWLEYSISASLVTWNVAVLSGVLEVGIVILVAVLGNIALQATGFLAEWQLSSAYQKLKPRDRVKASGSVYRWLAFIAGAAIFAAQWVTIFVVFQETVEAASTPVPDFVFVLVWAIFGLYALFPAVFIVFYGPCAPRAKAFYGISFIVLSFVSKAALDAVIIIGALSAR